MGQASIKEYTFKKAAQKRIPVSGTFELTSRCNLSCRMCYIHMNAKDQCCFGKELSTQQWLQIADEAIEAGMIYCLLTGGEPLLRPDFKEIYTYLVKKGVLVTVNTNGILITPEIVQLFQEYRPEKINISLYGASEETYQRVCNQSMYKKAKEGILMLKEAGIRVNINTTFTKLNESDLNELVTFAKEEGIPIRTTAFVFPPVRNKQNAESDIYLSQKEMGILSAKFDSLTMDQERIKRRQNYIHKCLSVTYGEEAIEKKLSCMAGRGSFWISWNGEMYPCGMLDGYKAYIIKDSFTNVWKNICEQTNTIVLPKECSVCKYQKICASCAAVSASLYEKTNHLPIEMCERTEAYIQEFLKLNKE